MKQTAVVVCPGRGTYNMTESGYLGRYHALDDAVVKAVDAYRRKQGQIPVSELDQMPWNARTHTTGDNASALIYTCAMMDYLAIDRDRFDIVAVTGNSMGWYLALACAAALDKDGAIHLINTMGTLMHQQGVGGQVVYPLVNAKWQPDDALHDLVNTVVQEASDTPGAEVYTSIRLGGMVVLAGNEAGVRHLLKKLPPRDDRYPMKLRNHAAFHTPLLSAISAQAKSQLGTEWFHPPEVPLIDGRGRQWLPYSTDRAQLHDYTLGHQVIAPYDFTRAVEVAVKEFAPDKLILLGPGSTLGAPVAQTLIALNWEGMRCRKDFEIRQNESPFVLSMGRETQRRLVTGE